MINNGINLSKVRLNIIKIIMVAIYRRDKIHQVYCLIIELTYSKGKNNSYQDHHQEMVGYLKRFKNILHKTGYLAIKIEI